MKIRVLRITCVLIIVFCIFSGIALHLAYAQSSPGGPAGGNTAGGTGAGGHGMADSTTSGTYTGFSSGQQGGGTHPLAQGSSSISFGGRGVPGTPGLQPDVLQQTLYGSTGTNPALYGMQPDISGTGNLQNSIYAGGYGGYSQQAPYPGGGQPSIQAINEPAAGESCMSACTEQYTPFECRTQYCPAGG